MLSFFSNKNQLQEDALSGVASRREKVYQWLYQNRDVRQHIDHLLREGNSLGIDTDEVIQEAMIRLDRALTENNFKGESNIVTYFKTICANYVSDKVFKKKKFASSVGDINDLSLLKHNEDNDFLKKEEKEEFDIIFQQLDEKCKDYLEQYYLDEKKMKEIADEKGKQEQTIKNDMAKCREKLRNLLIK